MAFTKLYLGTGTAPYTPATLRGAWDDTAGAVTRALVPVKVDGGTITTVARAETNVSPTWDVLLYRGVSLGLPAQTISGTLTVILGTLESLAAADLYWHLHVYVTQGDSDTPRGTLLTDYVESTTNEWPTTAAGTGFQSAQTLASLAITAGDRLVVEIGYVARNSVATSYTGTLSYGTRTAAGPVAADLTVGSPNVTTLAGFLEFSSSLTETPPSARLSQFTAETLSHPTPDARLGQLVAETVSSLSLTAPVSARLTQLVAETLSKELSVESRVSQLVVETISETPPSPVRVSQAPVEILEQAPTVARVSQAPVEVLAQLTAARVAARVSQAPLEILYPFGCYPRPVAPGESPRRLIRRLRRAPHVADPQAHRRIAYAKFALDLQRGVGLPVGQGSDPLVLLRVSRDGGKTWGEPVTMRAGALGAYTTRVLARRLGQARDAVFEVTVSDPVAWSLVQAWLDLEPGSS